MFYERLKLYSIRAALFGVAFTISSLLMAAVGGAFHHVSSPPLLRDTPEARATMAGCTARPGREAQRECRVQAVAAAQARDAAGTRLAAAQPPP